MLFRSSFNSRVTGQPSSKTSYVVLGAEAGPKKIEMIQKHKIKTLTEDTFLELIGKRPSGANDPKFIEAQKKEQAKIKEEAKKLAPAKPGVCVRHRMCMRAALLTSLRAGAETTRSCSGRSNTRRPKSPRSVATRAASRSCPKIGRASCRERVS